MQAPNILLEKRNIPPDLLEYFEPAGCGQCYMCHLLGIFDEVKRVLKKSGTIWVNIGDSFSGSNCGSNDYRLAEGLNPKYRKGIYVGQKVGKTEIPPKSMLCIPERFIIGMVERGWILRNKLVWCKQILFEGGLTLGSVMPSSVKDRFNQTWEPVYFFTKSPRYYFNLDAVRVKNQLRMPYKNQYPKGNKSDTQGSYITFENQNKYLKNLQDNYQGKFSGLEEAEKFKPRGRMQRKEYIQHRKPGRWRERPENPDGMNRSRKMFEYGICSNPEGKNPGSCWLIGTDPLAENHFAAYPEALCIRPILAGSPPGGIILDPFAGRGTTGIVAFKARRQFIGFDASPEYVELANKNLEPYKKQEVLKL